MSARRPAEKQPGSFSFTPDTLAKAEELLTRYPAERKRSAVIPLLWIVQKQNKNWLSIKAMEAVAEYLEMAYIRVYEVATFYSMFNLAPVGRRFVQVCTTTPCMLAGSDEIVAVCKKRIHPEQNHVREDGAFSWLEVECLGACANAPMVQINDDYYEDLNADNFNALLDAFERGETPRPGPQNGRFGSEPVGEAAPQGATQSVNATVALAEKG